MKKQLRIGVLAVMSTLLLSPNVPLAAQGQLHDSSRRLYDRGMEEFKHRDYEAVLARKAIDTTNAKSEPIAHALE